MRAPRILGLVVASIALAAVLFLFVLPTRTYLAQRQSLAAAQTRLNVFRDQNNQLATQAGQLQSNTEIERLARQQYGLVKPGEKAFVILPATSAGAPGPAAGARPASVTRHPARRGLLSRVWNDVQFWN